MSGGVDGWEDYLFDCGMLDENGSIRSTSEIKMPSMAAAAAVPKFNSIQVKSKVQAKNEAALFSKDISSQQPHNQPAAVLNEDDAEPRKHR